MENQQKNTDDYATEYAASVALTCKDNGDPLPEAFINLLVTAYVAGYNHVGETVVPHTFDDELRTYFTLTKEGLPETDNVGKCMRCLSVLYIREDNVLVKSYAWYGIAGFFSSPAFYFEHQLKNVIAWRYDD